MLPPGTGQGVFFYRISHIYYNTNFFELQGLYCGAGGFIIEKHLTTTFLRATMFALLQAIEF